MARHSALPTFSSPPSHDRIRSLAMLAILATSGIGCADMTPRPGDTVTLAVSRQMTEAWYRHGRKLDVANALAQGIGESEIASGRLAVVTCALPQNEPNPETRWVIRLPDNITPQRDDLVLFKPGARYGSAGPLGAYVKTLPPPASSELYTWKYGKTVRCAAGKDEAMQQARFAFAFGSNDLREYRLHRERMRGIDENDVRAGRIFTATCSPMTDGWIDWTVRVPPSMQVAAGDHIVARVGTPDGVALRKTDRPANDQTYAVQGSRIVRCNAPVSR